MNFTNLDASNAEAERLKYELKKIENEKERLEKELSELEGRRQAILDELGEFTDDKYEENMLALVYEQRRSGGGKK